MNTKNDWVVTGLIVYQAMLGYIATNASVLGISNQVIGVLSVIGVGVAVVLNRLDSLGAAKAAASIATNNATIAAAAAIGNTAGIASAGGLPASTINAAQVAPTQSPEAVAILQPASGSASASTVIPPVALI